MEVVLLARPTAGRGRDEVYAGRALRLLRASGVLVHPVHARDADEALDLAREGVARGVETLVVVGDDDLVRVGADAVAGTTARLGVVPAGSGNDLARALGIPHDDQDAAVRVLLGGRERRVDLLGVSGRHHATVLSAGLDALVDEHADRAGWAPGSARGRMGRGLATLDRLRLLRPVEYTLDLDGETLRTEATLVAVAGTATFRGGLRIAPGAEPDDGLLDVVVLAPLSRRELVRAWARLRTGTIATHPAWSSRRARRVTVAASGVVAYADRERVGPLPLTVEAQPGACRVVVP